MICRPYVTACAIVFFALAAPARADSDIEILMNPHAGSAEKLHAVSRLSRMGKDALPAAYALARQSKFDQPPIRELALATLIKLVGKQDARRLREQVDRDMLRLPAFQNSDEATLHVIASAKTWTDLPTSTLFAHYATPVIRRAALVAALRIWDQTHTTPPEDLGFDLIGRQDFVAMLSATSATFTSAQLRSAVEFAAALHSDGPQAVPLLLVALADTDPATRAAAQPAADRLFKAQPDQPRPLPATFNQVVAGIVQVLVQPRSTVRLTATASECLHKMGPAAEPVAAIYALAHLLRGNPKALSLLKSWSADKTPLAQAVLAIVNGPAQDRQSLAAFLDALATDPRQASQRAIDLLSAPDNVPLRINAATLIAAASADRIDRHASLYTCVAAGIVQPAAVMSALHLDPDRVSRDMAQLLRNIPSARQAALETLKYPGLHGPEIEQALEPLLDDPDVATRRLVAQLLHRTDVIARLELPQLLKELRSDSVDRRMLAARKLDDLGVEPPLVTAALVRAVDRRNMPAREGFIAALETANASKLKTLAVLNSTATASPDPTTRAYARAALREIATAP